MRTRIGSQRANVFLCRVARHFAARPDDRNDAFYKLHRKWFTEFSLEDRILAIVKQFPLIEKSAATLLFRKALAKKEEGAELFVRTDARNVVVAVRSERFLEGETFEHFLRHELTHISDMLDPACGYEPSISVPDASPAEQIMLRDRYRVLWDITIDGRLHREERRAASRVEFEKAFSHWSGEKRNEVFERLWTTGRPSHRGLFELSKKQTLTAPNLPGAPCALCKFPTFDWAGIESLKPPIVAAIQKHFPKWTPAHGACSRCVEIYEAAPLEMPATLFV
ncbi:MAG: hypothetical protein EXS18_00180 [Verrucomicrobiae bacterium]|nr:hypothetical protein [Verrucomicrobiae bacterium]